MKKSLSVILLVVILAILPISMAETESFSNNPDMIEKAALSVLKLTTFDVFGDPIATGSGFLMFDNMTLITNYHVMEDAFSIIAESDEGYRYIISGIKVADQQKDIAILQFMTPTVMSPLEYSTDNIKRGERVTAIGSPVGLKNSVSMGNISAVFTEANVSWIQTTAPISHGSSGGALFNEAGKVIGITSATRSDGQNINFAINISEAISLYDTWDHSVIDLDKQADLAYKLLAIGMSYYYGEDYRTSYENGYEKNRKHEQNYDLAYKYFSKAAEMGHSFSIYMLGLCFAQGHGAEQNYQTAVKFFTQAAQMGEPMAMYCLGLCYENGNGVSINNKKAIEYYQQASDHNIPDAMYSLGRCYYLGIGVDYNENEAFYWTKKSAELGNQDSMIMLALFYDTGVGTKTDYQKAFEWYNKAAELGNSYAMYSLGYCYKNGRGVAVNKRKMIEWFVKATELGNTQAMVGLGNCYYAGDGVKKDVETAFKIMLEAANLGEPTAMSFVGICYYNGEGVQKNTKLGKEWLQKAANAGESYAQQVIKTLK